MAKKLRPGGRILANISDDAAVAGAILEAFPGRHGVCVTPGPSLLISLLLGFGYTLSMKLTQL